MQLTWVTVCFTVGHCVDLCPSPKYFKRHYVRVDTSDCMTNFTTRESCMNNCFENSCIAALFADYEQFSVCCTYYNIEYVYYFHGELILYYKSGASICEANFQPPECISCLNKYDITTGCQFCHENYDITNDCTTCMGNYDINSECTECIKHYDINTQCTECIGHYDIDTECTECIGHYDIDTECTECIGHYDIDTECTECIEHYDLNTKCIQCIRNFDLKSGCTNCEWNWAGGKCDFCNFGLTGPDCTTCARGVKWVGEYKKYNNHRKRKMELILDFAGQSCQSFTGLHF